MTTIGMHAYPQADPHKDVQVRLETAWLTFQVQSSGASSAAVFTVFGMPGSPIQDLRNLVVHDVHGAVVGPHRVVVVGAPCRPTEIEVGRILGSQVNAVSSWGGALVLVCLGLVAWRTGGLHLPTVVFVVWVAVAVIVARPPAALTPSEAG